MRITTTGDRPVNWRQSQHDNNEHNNSNHNETKTER